MLPDSLDTIHSTAPCKSRNLGNLGLMSAPPVFSRIVLVLAVTLGGWGYIPTYHRSWSYQARVPGSQNPLPKKRTLLVQVVLSWRGLGAHCCTHPMFVPKSPSRWVPLKSGQFIEMTLGTQSWIGSQAIPALTQIYPESEAHLIPWWNDFAARNRCFGWVFSNLVHNSKIHNPQFQKESCKRRLLAETQCV